MELRPIPGAEVFDGVEEDRAAGRASKANFFGNRDCGSERFCFIGVVGVVTATSVLTTLFIACFFIGDWLPTCLPAGLFPTVELVRAGALADFFSAPASSPSSPPNNTNG